MTSATHFPEIQKWLSEQGKNLTGGPIYRLVWSDLELEARLGTYNDYSGNLFLRQVTEVRKVKKYSYVPSRWILEKWFVQPPTRELPDPNGYEPFYVFENGKGEFLPPNLKVVQFILEVSNTEIYVSRDQRALEMRNIFDDKSAKELEQIEDSLECSPITNALHMKEGVGYRKVDQQ